MGWPEALASWVPSYEGLVSAFNLYDDAHPTVQVDSCGIVSCCCSTCKRWHAFTAGQLPWRAATSGRIQFAADGSDSREAGDFFSFRQYEVFSREMLAELSNYLWSRSQTFCKSSVRILEVGAGDGRLSAFLSALAEQHYSAPSPKNPVSLQFEATDISPRLLELPSSGFASNGAAELITVQQCDAVAAVQRYKPDIVLISWMPMGVDWTADIRDVESVREYILLGETEGGICGNESTWDFLEDDLAGDYEHCRQSTGWKMWRRESLCLIERWQIAKTDEIWSSNRHSHCVSFKRMNPQ